MKVKSLPVEFKTGPKDGLEEGQFLVYPSTFTRTPDSYGDVVAKGAFLDDIKAWKESGNVLPGLFGHRMDDPDYFIAGAIEEGEDEHGWWVKGEFDLENPKARQVYRLVKGRRLSQLSFAYDVIDEAGVVLEDGTKANELRRLKRYEFSFVPVGANPDTSVVAVKSAIDALAKAGRVISKKNENALREARDSIDTVLASLGDEEAGKSPLGAPQGQQEASGHVDVKSEASGESSPSVDDEEPMPDPSVENWAAHLSLLALGNE